MPTEEVDLLPYDINGTKKYVLQFEMANRMESSRDGRTWKRYMPSKRKGFDGIRRLAECVGSFRCDNDKCSYATEYGISNRHHFKGKDYNCKHCKRPAIPVPCEARKIWEFDDSSKTVVVYHYGEHNCIPKENHKKLSDDNIIEEFKKNPKLRPCQVASKAIVEAMSEGKDWQEIDSIVDTVADESHTKNLKKKAVREMNPFGHSFEAIGILKESTDQKDKFLIYEVNDRRLNGSPFFVFKTSKFQMGLAFQMDRKKSNLLSTEYCHFDGKADRCPGYTTLVASVFHPILHQMCPLAIMEAEGESGLHVKMFWELFQKALREYTGKDSVDFSPFGFISDEGGGIWKGLTEVFSSEIMANSVSCEFHFKQNVNRLSKSIPDKKDRKRFKKLAFQLLESVTVTGYHQTLNLLENFIQDKKEERKQLSNWLKWWDSRRIHWSRAFKANLLTPAANLAEVVNTSLAHHGTCRISLARAAQEDTAKSLLVARQWERYSEGTVSVGTGPNEVSKQAREQAKQVAEAKRMAAELVNFDDVNYDPDAIDEAFRSFTVDPKSKHRPVDTPKVKKKGRPKVKHTSAYEPSSEESCDEGSDLRPETARPFPSKEFKNSLKKAIADKDRIKVRQVSYEALGDYYEFMLSSKKTIQITKTNKANFYDTYCVNLSQTPSCDCPFATKTRGTICKHVLWVLLFIFKVPEDSRLLYQVGLTKSEFSSVKHGFPGGIPENFLHDPKSVPTVENIENSDEKNNEGEATGTQPKHKKLKKQQKWAVSHYSKQKGPKPKCKKCNRTVVPGQIHVMVEGLFFPPEQTFALESKFRYCLDKTCLAFLPSRSNLTPCTKLFVDKACKLEDFELAILLETNIPYVYDQ